MEFASAFLSSASTALQAAQAAAQKSTLSSTYTIDNSIPTLSIGVWTIQRAKHNSNGKQVSIWNCDKTSLVNLNGSTRSSASRQVGGGSSSGSQRERDQERFKYAIDVLKKEASSLSRLRHPCILEMSEPPTETRSTLTFATEPVLASLSHSIKATNSIQQQNSSSSSTSRRNNHRQPSQAELDLELDEVEIQKGMSQIAKGLQFLHESVKLVHRNLTPECIIINSKGDWKLSGFGLSTYLNDPNDGGMPAKWEFPNFDPSLSSYIQRDYDYIAPEYILDESPPSPSNDLYSLGCILHSIHLHSGPPFLNHQNLSSTRENIEHSLSLLTSQWRRLPLETQQVLNQLITRYPNRRLSAKQFLESEYFGGLLVKTLRFLERDTFGSKGFESQSSFLKGLITVLPSFTSKVNRQKILPTLLELTLIPPLIPFLLQPILYIASQLPSSEFQKEVLPSLKPLFTLKEPTQAVVGLLDNVVGVFKEKCSEVVFREEVMPLVYHALESDNPVVLEKALKTVPPLCEHLDYTTVKGTLFPKITTVFSKTTLLSVKVNTLICFHSMIKLLDKFTLTEKLVPLLSKIKTKEPSVMIATLAVHEEMGKKCEVEAIATLILPQLWAMSIGPLLNVDQFTKFITVIKALSHRVETEHFQRLSELKRLEESSSNAAGGGGMNRMGGGLGAVNPSVAGVSDFEALVRGSDAKSEGLAARGRQVDIFSDESPAITPMPTGGAFSSPPLPALPSSSPPFMSSPAFSNNPIQQQQTRPTPTPRVSSSTAIPRSSLGARSVPSSSFNSTAFPQSTQNSPSFGQSQSNGGGLKSFAPLQPQASRPSSAQSSSSYSTPSLDSSSTPNYSFSSLSISSTSSGLPPLQPTSSSVFSQQSSPQYSQPPPLLQSQQQQQPQPIKWNVVPPLQPSRSNSSSSSPVPTNPTPQTNFPPGYSSTTTLQPTVRNPTMNGTNGTKAGWGAWEDLDPLK